MMSRTLLNSLVTQRSLTIVHEGANLTDHVFNTGLADDMTKNVCFRITNELSDRFDTTTKILEVSKRQFLECVLIDALNQADQVMRDEGVFNHFREANDLLNAEGRFTEADKAVAEEVQS